MARNIRITAEINAVFWVVMLSHVGETLAFLGNAPLTPLQAAMEQAYEALTPAKTTAAFIAQANAEGAKGYWYLNDYSFGSGSFALYAKQNTGNVTFSYEALAPASSAADFINKSNAEAAKGYRYLGDYSFGNDFAAVYIKDNSKNTTYSYQVLPPASTGTAADFINTANAQGSKGYGYYLDLTFLSDFSSVAIYIKDNTNAATFSYDALPLATSSAGFIAQANAEGAKGYGYYVDFSFDLPTKNSSAAIYVKNNANSSTFNYEVVSPPKSTAAFLSQASTAASNGFGYYTDLSFNPKTGDSGSIYVHSTATATPSLTVSISVVNCLFNWAEVHYPALFNPPTKNTEQALGYDYRYYSGSNVYLGVKDAHIHLLQPKVSTNIVDEGTVAQYQPVTGCQ